MFYQTRGHRGYNGDEKHSCFHWYLNHKAKKKKRFVSGFPTDPIFRSDPKLFFQLSKEIKKKEKKNGEKNHQNPLNGSKVTSNCRNSFVTLARSLFY